MQKQRGGTTEQVLNQTSASRFHSDPDILGEICKHFSPYDGLNWDALQVKESRRNLAWLALTCKVFLEPALDLLWRSLDTLFPLFNILPAFIKADGTHVLRGKVEQEDWERFDWYARRVKRFCYTRDPENLDIAMHVYFRMAQLRTATLLPALHHLICPDISQTDFLISGVCLFLSPSLHTLEFRKITSVEDKLTGTFLHTLWSDDTQLDSIVFEGNGLSLGTLNLILNFQSLRCLELTGMGAALELDWIKKLGVMPQIRDIALDFINSRIDVVEEDLGFKDLKSLMITAPISFTRAFLPHINTTVLETIVASSPTDTLSERSQFIGEVVDRWKATLRDFSLVHNNPSESVERIDMATLSPLTPLKRLTGFRLEGYSMMLTDDILRIMASAWPNLKKLLLPFLGPEATRPSVAALKILAELCPKLLHLRIPLDAVDVPPFVPPPIPFFALPHPSPPQPTISSLPPNTQSSSSTVPASSTFGEDDDEDETMFQDGAQTPRSNSTTILESYVVVPSPRKPHDLDRLTIATSDDTWDNRDQLHLARHIDYLFPHLRYVSGFQGHDDERWAHIHDIVQAFQTVRTETLMQQRMQRVS